MEAALHRNRIRRRFGAGEGVPGRWAPYHKGRKKEIENPRASSKEGDTPHEFIEK